MVVITGKVFLEYHIGFRYQARGGLRSRSNNLKGRVPRAEPVGEWIGGDMLMLAHVNTAFGARSL